MSPQDSCVEILTPTVTVLVCGAFGRWLGHSGGGLMSGFSSLTKEALESCHTLPLLHRDSVRS